jgi:rhodanese-related sulfurtransferase
MKRRYVLLMMLTGMMILGGTAGISWSQEKAPQRIEPRALNRIIENREALMMINGSSYLECMDVRIPGSVCASCDQGKELSNLWPANKETKLVFYSGNVPLEPGCLSIEEAQRRGFTKIYVLRGGLPAWKRAGFDTESVQRVPRRPSASIKPRDLESWRKNVKNPLVVDIRSPEAFGSSHLEGALNIPMNVLHQRYQDIPLDRSLLLVDEEGSRSFLAASYLFRKGFVSIGRLVGGMEAWTAYIRRGEK